MYQIEDGAVFSRLTVIRFSHKSRSGRFWECKCQCGTIKTINGSALRSKVQRSCGCLRNELTAARHITHGCAIGKFTKEYRTWRAMKNRCGNKNAHNFQFYGGRGITVCEAWRSFDVFLLDMGKCPQDFTIERKNVNEGYSKSNCMWIHKSKQSSNTRKSLWVQFNGEKYGLLSFSKLIGRNYEWVRKWLKKGATPETLASKGTQPCE